MKEKFVISIGCEYGSGGPEVGRKIAKDLDINYYDRELIDMILEETGFSKDILEKAETGSDLKGRSTGDNGQSLNASKYMNLTDRFIHVQSEIIKKLADKSSCVFIGRCSDYVLKDSDTCLRVFIYAPMEKRIENVMRDKNLSKEEAEKLIAERDRTLHARYKRMTGTFRGDRNNRHLLIDANLLGIEGTAKLIEELAEKVFA